jgi:hypothetical protein
MKETYLAVAGRIRQELQELKQVVDRTAHIWQKVVESTDDYYVDAVALNLHGFYAGLERVFELIAEGIDQSKPTGANWHQELLRQMTAEITNTRPPVISSTTRTKLDTYRGFRHVVRNVYTYHLDQQQIEVLVKQLPATLANVSQELTAFAGFLEQVAQ